MYVDLVAAGMSSPVCLGRAAGRTNEPPWHFTIYPYGISEFSGWEGVTEDICGIFGRERPLEELRSSGWANRSLSAVAGCQCLGRAGWRTTCVLTVARAGGVRRKPISWGPTEAEMHDMERKQSETGAAEVRGQKSEHKLLH